MNRYHSPGSFSFEGSSPLTKNIDNQFSLCREFESFEQFSPKFAVSIQSDKKLFKSNAKSNSTADFDKENIPISQFKEEQKMQEGIKKFRELGQTIQESISQIQNKFSETKNIISTFSNNKQGQQEVLNPWDQRLDQFYEQLFNHAKQALFKTQNENTPQKYPSSSLKGNISCSKSTSSKTQYKPNSCQRFEYNIIKRSNHIKINNNQIKNNVLITSPKKSPNINYKSSVSAQKFQIQNNKQQEQAAFQSFKQKPMSVGKFNFGLQQSKKVFKVDPISKNSKNIKKVIPKINLKSKIIVQRNFKRL